MSDLSSPSAHALEARLGQSLRHERIAQGLSQAELADRANVAVGTVKSLENARGSTLTTLVKIVRALGRETWIDALAPSPPTFNPLDLLAAQRSAATPAARPRVRRGRPGTVP